MKDTVFAAWGFVRELSRVTLFNPPGSTWNRADLMDNLYYVRPAVSPCAV